MKSSQLYLDGDTAPCLGFQNYVFDALQSADMLTTANPFGYVSTDGSLHSSYDGSDKQEMLAIHMKGKRPTRAAPPIQISQLLWKSMVVSCPSWFFCIQTKSE